MVSRLEMLCNREFGSILENRQVVVRLNELEALIADAAQRHGSADPDQPVPAAYVFVYSLSLSLVSSPFLTIIFISTCINLFLIYIVPILFPLRP